MTGAKQQEQVEVAVFLALALLVFFPWIMALVDTIAWFFVNHAVCINWTPFKVIFSLTYPVIVSGLFTSVAS